MNINGSKLIEDLELQIEAIENVKEKIIETEDWVSLIKLDAGISTMEEIKRAIKDGEYE